MQQFIATAGTQPRPSPSFPAVATPVAPSGPMRLIDAFTVNFGAAPILAEFCLRADRVFAEHGIQLFLSRDLAGLKRINDSNRESWFPLFPAFDVTLGGA